MSRSLDELYEFLSSTYGLPRRSFELKITATLPAGGSVTSLRTGSFDSTMPSGIGTRSFQTEGQGLVAQYGEAPYEYRITSETVWILDPLASPRPMWAGYPFAEFAELSGSQPFSGIDGVSRIDYLAGVVTEVLGVVEDADGSATWIVLVNGKDLVPIIHSNGPIAGIIELANAEGDLLVEVAVNQSGDGYITGFDVDLDEWWQFLLSPLDDSIVGSSMTVEFTMETFEEPLNLQPPCEDPLMEIDPNGLEILVCGA